MIKIQRGDRPPSLRQDPLLSAYQNKEDVTDALILMQNNKCAYCERSFDDCRKEVDHYRPLDYFKTGNDSGGNPIYDWNRANEWTNLLYSCSDCNGKSGKSNKLPFDESDNRVLIDPSFDPIDPEDHIDFIIDWPARYSVSVLICAKNNSSLGSSTIAILRLSLRAPYLGILSRLSLRLDDLFDKLLNALWYGKRENESECITKINEIEMTMHKSSSYSAFAKNFYRKRLEKYERDERNKIEEHLGRTIILNITIPGA